MHTLPFWYIHTYISILLFTYIGILIHTYIQVIHQIMHTYICILIYTYMVSCIRVYIHRFLPFEDILFYVWIFSSLSTFWPIQILVFFFLFFPSWFLLCVTSPFSILLTHFLLVPVVWANVLLFCYLFFFWWFLHLHIGFDIFEWDLFILVVQRISKISLVFRLVNFFIVRKKKRGTFRGNLWNFTPLLLWSSVIRFERISFLSCLLLWLIVFKSLLFVCYEYRTECFVVFCSVAISFIMQECGSYFVLVGYFSWCQVLITRIYYTMAIYYTVGSGGSTSKGSFVVFLGFVKKYLEKYD